MKIKLTFFILLSAILLLFSCDFKKEGKSINESKEIIISDEIIKEISNSSKYRILDSLRAKLNFEVRMSYNQYLINRTGNNTRKIIKTYQSELPFSKKRSLLKDLELDLSKELEGLVTKIEKTENELSSNFPILKDKNKKLEVMKKILEIKPQSGVSNPLDLKIN